jgi:hypothetical protein
MFPTVNELESAADATIAEIDRAKNTTDSQKIASFIYLLLCEQHRFSRDRAWGGSPN